MKTLALCLTAAAVIYIHRRRERIARAEYAGLARGVGAFYAEALPG